MEKQQQSFFKYKIYIYHFNTVWKNLFIHAECKYFIREFFPPKKYVYSILYERNQSPLNINICKWLSENYVNYDENYRILVIIVTIFTLFTADQKTFSCYTAKDCLKFLFNRNTFPCSMSWYMSFIVSQYIQNNFLLEFTP